MAHTEFGPKLLAKILAKLEGKAQQERESRFEGRRYVTIIRPASQQSKQETQSKSDETKNQKSSSQKVQDNLKGEDSKTSSNGIPPQKGQK